MLRKDNGWKVDVEIHLKVYLEPNRRIDSWIGRKPLVDITVQVQRARSDLYTIWGWIAYAGDVEFGYVHGNGARKGEDLFLALNLKMSSLYA